MTHTVTHDAAACGPSAPAPNTQDEHETKKCEGTITLECECCHSRLVSQTMVVETGPISTQDLAAFIATATSNYEQAGYLVLAHSLVDAGGGWLLALTIAWYV